MPEPIELPRKIRRQITQIRKSKVTGTVVIDGCERHVYQGHLVTPKMYASLVEAG